MTAPRTLAPAQHLAALALSALITAGVLLSVSAQADHSHAGALASAQAASLQQHCAAPQRGARG